MQYLYSNGRWIIRIKSGSAYWEIPATEDDWTELKDLLNLA